MLIEGDKRNNDKTVDYCMCAILLVFVFYYVLRYIVVSICSEKNQIGMGLNPTSNQAFSSGPTTADQ